jgi:acetyl esterase/lipase
MKHIVILLSIIICSLLIFSCGSDPYKGKANQTFKKTLLSRAISPRSDQKFHKYEFHEDSNIKYENTDNQYGILDFYQCENPPVSEPLPLIIWMHSGGFIFNDKDEQIIHKLAIDFTRAGYHCASINYSLIDDIQGLAYPFSRVYKGIQDARAAIRYFRANAEKYNIDPNKIYLGGFSAGAVLALHTVFTNPQNSDFFDVKEGGLDAIPIIQTAKYNANLDKYGGIAGVISLSGALLDPRFVNDSHNPPLLLVHGTNDKIVPEQQGKLFEEFVKDKDFSLPALFFQLGICDKQTNECVETKYSAKFGVTIPSYVFGGLRDLLTRSREVSGSRDIQDFAASRCYRISIQGAPHCFMLTPEGGFNETYAEIRDEIALFLEATQEGKPREGGRKTRASDNNSKQIR